MSRSVFVSGFESESIARQFGETFIDYHNNRHHIEGKPLFMEELSDGHYYLYLGLIDKRITLGIPLYSSEPRSHGYDTVVDILEVLRKTDPDFSHMIDKIDIQLDAS